MRLGANARWVAVRSGAWIRPADRGQHQRKISDRTRPAPPQTPVPHVGLDPLSGTSPGVGRRPTTLLNDAGLRMLPP